MCVWGVVVSVYVYYTTKTSPPFSHTRHTIYKTHTHNSQKNHPQYIDNKSSRLFLEGTWKIIYNIPTKSRFQTTNKQTQHEDFLTKNRSKLTGKEQHLIPKSNNTSFITQKET